MSLVRYTNAPLTIESGDMVVAGVAIAKIKATLDFLKYNPTAKEVTIQVIITPYARNADGTFGDKLDGTNPAFRSFTKMFTANMQHYCDANTGQVLCAVADEYAADGTLNPLLVNKTYCPEFEFYDNLAFSQAVVINTLITNRIQLAAATGEILQAN